MEYGFLFHNLANFMYFGNLYPFFLTVRNMFFLKEFGSLLNPFIMLIHGQVLMPIPKVSILHDYQFSYSFATIHPPLSANELASY